jgi:hypothetical protein
LVFSDLDSSFSKDQDLGIQVVGSFQNLVLGFLRFSRI